MSEERRRRTYSKTSSHKPRRRSRSRDGRSRRVETCASCRCKEQKSRDRPKSTAIVHLDQKPKTVDGSTQTPPLSEISMEAAVIWGGEAITKLKTMTLKRRLHLATPQRREFVKLDDRFHHVKAEPSAAPVKPEPSSAPEPKKRKPATAMVPPTVKMVEPSVHTDGVRLSMHGMPAQVNHASVAAAARDTLESVGLEQPDQPAQGGERSAASNLTGAGQASPAASESVNVVPVPPAQRSRSSDVRTSPSRTVPDRKSSRGDSGEVKRSRTSGQSIQEEGEHVSPNRAIAKRVSPPVLENVAVAPLPPSKKSRLSTMCTPLPSTMRDRRASGDSTEDVEGLENPDQLAQREEPSVPSNLTTAEQVTSTPSEIVGVDAVAPPRRKSRFWDVRTPLSRTVSAEKTKTSEMPAAAARASAGVTDGQKVNGRVSNKLDQTQPQAKPVTLVISKYEAPREKIDEIPEHLAAQLPSVPIRECSSGVQIVETNSVLVQPPVETYHTLCLVEYLPPAEAARRQSRVLVKKPRVTRQDAPPLTGARSLPSIEVLQCVSTNSQPSSSHKENGEANRTEQLKTESKRSDNGEGTTTAHSPRATSRESPRKGLSDRPSAVKHRTPPVSEQPAHERHGRSRASTNKDCHLERNPRHADEYGLENCDRNAKEIMNVLISNQLVLMWKDKRRMLSEEECWSYLLNSRIARVGIAKIDNLNWLGPHQVVKLFTNVVRLPACLLAWRKFNIHSKHWRDDK